MEVYTCIKFVFRRTFDRLFHVEEGVVGVNAPMFAQVVAAGKLNAPIFEFSHVDIARTSVDTGGSDEIFSVDVEDIGVDLSLASELLCE